MKNNLKIVLIVGTAMLVACNGGHSGGTPYNATQKHSINASLEDYTNSLKYEPLSNSHQLLGTTITRTGNQVVFTTESYTMVDSVQVTYNSDNTCSTPAADTINYTSAAGVLYRPGAFYSSDQSNFAQCNQYFNTTATDGGGNVYTGCAGLLQFAQDSMASGNGFSILYTYNFANGTSSSMCYSNPSIGYETFANYTDPSTPVACTGTNCGLSQAYPNYPLLPAAASTGLPGSAIKNTGVYTSKGSFGPNAYPAAKSSAAAWTDASGKYWIFGGTMGNVYSSTIYITDNDLWTYDPTTNQWKWVSGSQPNTTSIPVAVSGASGVESSGYTPGGKAGAVSWLTSDGKMWIYGGYGAESQVNKSSTASDMWRFNPTTSKWAWISGTKALPTSANNYGSNYGAKGVESSGNTPGGRYGSAPWVDSADYLWVFGGAGWANGIGAESMRNDLWKYNTGTHAWTWVAGTNLVNQSGTYGALNVASSTNIPGARKNAKTWTVGTTVYLFGGYGYDSTGALGNLNDMWKFDGTNWTWIGGSDTISHAGVYGTWGVEASTNWPGTRGVSPNQAKSPFVSGRSLGWVDSNNNLWMFGGYGIDMDGGAAGCLSDLWRYNTQTGYWTWISINSLYPNYSLGTVDTRIVGLQDVGLEIFSGFASTQYSGFNVPGCRSGGTSWYSASTGKFWMFGGYGFDGSNSGSLNDMWSISTNSM